MSGLGMQVLSPELIALQGRLDKLARPNFVKLLTEIGGVVESQTRRRIKDEKTAPNGSAWAPWTDEYAKTRHANQSLLFASGDLEDSITFETVGFELYVGSNLAYARNQNEGTTVTQREYLGLSEANEREVVDVTEKFFNALVPS